jgi:hypothetical protein
MLTELNILKDVTRKFEQLNIQYMLTGSLAMSHYAQPRMTRDIDLVVNILPSIVKKMESVFTSDYYISIDSINDAIDNEFIFNLIHTKSSIKIDCIVRKKEEYRVTEFERRQKIRLTDFEIYIVSKEDLIISKLIWFKESGSDLQKRDIKNLLNSGYDRNYLLNWIGKLNLEKQFESLINE